MQCDNGTIGCNDCRSATTKRLQQKETLFVGDSLVFGDLPISRQVHRFLQSRMTENEPQSWADMVRTIDKERKHLPWDPNTTKPVERVSNYHV